MEVYIHLYHFISSEEWRFIFVFITSFQAGNGGLYSSLPLTFQVGNGGLCSSLPLHFKQGMEVYIRLYHFISSGEWRFRNEVVKMKINLHSPIEM
jgi:hypothetical protein